MKTRYIFLLLFFFIIFSCNDNDIGIFYGLKNEEKIKKGSLPVNITAGSMARAGANLYLAAGNVWTRPANSTWIDWARVNPPKDGFISTSLASSPNVLYAIYYHRNTADRGFYSRSGNAAITDEWTLITASHEGTIESVKSAGSTIFVSTRDSGNTGRLYRFDGNSFIEINLPTPMVDSTFHVVSDEGTGYLIATRNSIYRVNNSFVVSTPPLLSPSSTIGESSIIGGLARHSDGRIFFTYWNLARTGYVAVVNADGTGFSSKGMGTFEVNGIKIFDSQASDIPYYILVGTSGRGYWQAENLNIGTIQRRISSNPVSNNYNSAIQLQFSVVHDFFIDDNNDLYALTNTRGLWRNTSGVWSIE